VGPPGPNLSKGPQLLCDATGGETKRRSPNKINYHYATGGTDY